ncbi:hypothetical protein R5R35_012572 [Gryllus longicercus]|uniref:UDP-glucuronosyltransferase n=1 Tax=Gryllus longicercus TaxID=2509291 RepID=A0AAN9Z801_9ORTH
MKHTIQMAKLVIFATLFLLFTPFISAANILAIFPLPSPSHHFWNSPLVVALAKKGHNVTVVSQLPQLPPVPNVTDLVVEELLARDHHFGYEEMVDAHPLTTVDAFLGLLGQSCLKIQKSDSWAKLLRYPTDTKFDLVIIEPMGAECLLGILPRFGDPPIIAVNAFNVPLWLFEMVGSPNMISFMPHHHLAATDRMSFTERLRNFYYTAYTYYYYHYDYLPRMDQAAKEFYGPHIPSFYKIRENVRLGMANFHPILDYPYAKTPNLISVAGIQIQEPKPLSQDLKKFLDEAKEGAILVSFGSNIAFQHFAQEKIKLFAEVFASIPQRVLWKFEADKLPVQPENIRIGKWLPQNDILAHRNVKLFITHAGLLSIHEAIYHGVPVIGIPIFAEQPMNIQKVINHGAGISLNYNYLTKESFIEGIKTVLENSSFRDNIRVLSQVFKDDPQTPLERAVFWTEYVLRHKGALHLQSAAKDLNIFQYFLLDIISFLVAVPLILFVVIYCVCCRRQSKKRKEKQH